jgi:hypothetical protein
MKSKKTVSMFFSIAFIGTCAVSGPSAWAAQNDLMFHGSLVNAACEARVMAGTDAAAGWKTLSAGGSLTIGLMAGDNACGKPAVPVYASYKETTIALRTAHAGIVTLTYQ